MAEIVCIGGSRDGMKERTQRHCDFCKKRVKSWKLRVFTKTLSVTPDSVFTKITMTNYACENKKCLEDGRMWLRCHQS